ncbi:hypothetical protein QCA50_007942 [Cerrena zonata]|uniref:Fucose-specific lectin n=1 Tax=Cerrena zonata TaxID=2478898 RepID=A0AAW0GIH0_9APHY
MSSTKVTIALIGSHSDDVVAALQKASLKSTTHKSSTATELASLLEDGKVLLATEPGDHLSALHTATQTPIDISAMKPTKERPLIVYKVNGRIKVVRPPKLKTDIKITGTTVDKNGTASAIPEKKVKLALQPFDLDQLVKQLRQAVTSIDSTTEGAPSLLSNVDNLDPGNDVAFYKQVVMSFPVSFVIETLAWSKDGHFQVDTSDPHMQQTYDTDWTATIYVYATNTNPTGKTGSNYNGIIYTYVVHDGIHQRQVGGPRRWLGPKPSPPGSSECSFYFIDQMEYMFADTSEGTQLLSRIDQQPNDNIFQNTNNSFIYTIDRSQNMTLFKANQKQTWQFNAQYSKSCAWSRFQLQSDIPRQSQSGYLIAYNDLYDVHSDPGFETEKWWNPGVFDRGKDPHAVKVLPDDDLPIAGLSVFKSTVGKAPLLFDFEYTPRAFKANQWHTDSDDNQTHWQVSGAGLCGFYDDEEVLDLTW